MAAGGAHFVLLALNHSSPLYIIGDNRYGQLGELYPDEEEDCLKEMTFFSIREGFPGRITSIHCGFRHSVALTSDGDAYIWGWVSDQSDPFTGPVPVDIGEEGEFPNVQAVACGAETSLFLLQDGSVWILGQHDTIKARQVPLPKPARQIAAAQWSYYALIHG